MLFICQPSRKMSYFEKPPPPSKPSPSNKPSIKSSLLQKGSQGRIRGFMALYEIQKLHNYFQHLCSICACSSFVGPSEAAANPQVINTREKFFSCRAIFHIFYRVVQHQRQTLFLRASLPVTVPGKTHKDRRIYYSNV